MVRRKIPYGIWTRKLRNGFFGSDAAICLKAHISEEGYYKSEGREVPITHKQGARIYVMARPCILEPDYQLTIEHVPTACSTGRNWLGDLFRLGGYKTASARPSPGFTFRIAPSFFGSATRMTVAARMIRVLAKGRVLLVMRLLICRSNNSLVGRIAWLLLSNCINHEGASEFDLATKALTDTPNCNQ